MKMLSVKKVALCGLLLMGSYSARGQGLTLQDIADLLKEAQYDIGMCALSYRMASPTDALDNLTLAQEKLGSVHDGLLDPTIVSQLGTSYAAMSAKVNTCITKVDAVWLLIDPYATGKAKPQSAVLSQLFSAGKLVAATETVVKKGMLSGKMVGSEKLIIAPQGDVFNYKAGKVANFKVYPPGYPSPDAVFPPPPALPPSIAFKNLDVCNALNGDYVWTLSKDRRYYTLSLLMGPDEGPSHFELTYNGQTTEQLVVNRGGSGAASLPYGFPTYMQTGNYQMGMSVNGTSWWTDYQGRHSTNISIPDIYIPYTIYLQNLRSFANLIVKMFNQMAPAFTAGSGITSIAATCTSSTDTRVVLTFSARFGDGANGGIVNVSIIMTHI
jgi:hypothetical protein